MPRLLLLPLALFLLPDVAHAASGGALADVSATIIAYSKIILFVGGLSLIVRLVFQSKDGKDASGTWWLLLSTVVLPFVFLAMWERLPGVVWQGSALASGGRSFLEAMLSDVGLLNANLLGGWELFRLTLVSVFFASLVAVLLKANSMDGENGVAHVKGWIIPSILILGVFWPGWVSPGAATSADVISRLSTGQNQQSLPFNMSSNDEILSKLSSAKNLPLSKSRDPQIPVVLSILNSSMDQAVQSIAVMFGSSTFSQFGLINSRRAVNSIRFNFPANADLQARMGEFVNNCFAPALAQKKVDLGNGPSKENAREFNPFSKQYLSFYRKFSGCGKWVSGGYKWRGRTFSTPLADEVLGVLAFADPSLKKWHHWQNVEQAIAAAPTMRNSVFNLPDSKFYFSNTADALVARAVQGSFYRSPGGLGVANNLIQSQRTGVNDNIFTSLAGLMGGQGFALVEAAKGAASTENVNLRMPIYMGLVQCLLLSLFPIVLLLSIIPGRASWVGYFLSVLFWSKSYLIAWAIISNIDTWYQSLDGLTTAQELAMTNVIQQAQMYSPLLMGLLIFGPVAGHQMMSRGGGAA